MSSLVDTVPPQEISPFTLGQRWGGIGRGEVVEELVVATRSSGGDRAWDEGKQT